MTKRYDEASTSGEIMDDLLPDFECYVLLQTGYFGTQTAEIRIGDRHGMVIQVEKL